MKRSTQELALFLFILTMVTLLRGKPELPQLRTWVLDDLDAYAEHELLHRRHLRK